MREWCAMHGLFQWLKGILPIFVVVVALLLIYGYFYSSYFSRTRSGCARPDFLYLSRIVYYNACINCLFQGTFLQFDLLESWFKSRFGHFYDSIRKIANTIWFDLLLLLLFLLPPLTSWLMCTLYTILLCNSYWRRMIHVKSWWDLWFALLIYW